MIASARGESANASRFNWNEAKMKIIEQANRKKTTKRRESSPAARGQFWVLGFKRSNLASDNRLNDIAQDRAETMATKIQSNVRQEGKPFAATRALIRANGKANTECSTLIIRKTRRSLANIEGSTRRRSAATDSIAFQFCA